MSTNFQRARALFEQQQAASTSVSASPKPKPVDPTRPAPTFRSTAPPKIASVSSSGLAFRGVPLQTTGPSAPVNNTKRPPAQHSPDPARFVPSSSQPACPPPERKALQDIQTGAILLLGQTGHGKSSIVNAIFDCNVSRESGKMTSCTDEVGVFEGHWFGRADLERVTVIDTPGFLDSEGRDAVHLEALVEFFANFPNRRLCVVLITLPLSESRAKSTYADMVEQAELLLGEEALTQTVFVTTMENLMNPALPQLISGRKSDWRHWLEHSCFIDSPKLCNFLLGQPQSLAFVREYFQSCQPITPSTSEKIQILIDSNPGASVADCIEKVEAINLMKADMENKMAAQLQALQQAQVSLQDAEALSARQRQQLQRNEEKIQETQTKIAQMPAVIYRYVHVPRGGCLSGASLVHVRDGPLEPEHQQGASSMRPISELKEGQFVETVGKDGQLAWSEVYFVDCIADPLLMFRLTLQPRSGPSDRRYSTLMSGDHIIFAHAQDNDDDDDDDDDVDDDSSVLDAVPVVASSLAVGDVVFAAPLGSSACLPCTVVGIDHVTNPERWTVLVKEHRLLVDSVLVSSHVVNHEWGIADNAVMLFLYNHVSASFVTSPFNKWFCRKWDDVFEPMAIKIADWYRSFSQSEIE